MCYLDALSQKVVALPQDIAQEAKAVGRQLLRFTISLISDVTRIIKNSDACDSALRFVAETTSFVDLTRRSDKIARPLLATIAVTRGLLDATRIFRSIDYVVSGGLYRDIIERKIVPVFTNIAFLLARSISLLHWCVEQKMASWETLEKAAMRVGGQTAFRGVNVLKSTKVVDSLFLGALSGLVVQEAKAIYRGEDVVQHLFSLVSLSADVASIILGLAGMANVYVTTALAIIAAGTGVVAFFVDPANITI